MIILKRYGLMLAVIGLLSLLGASAASARPEGGQEANPPAVIPGLDGSVVPQAAAYPEVGSTFGLDPSVIADRNCYSQWTGRWIITYLRQGEGHWVTWCRLYVPDFINNEADAQAWRWSEEYIADHCSLDSEPQTWQGIYLYTQKEYIRKCINEPSPSDGVDGQGPF
jgi:hypothetical protein